jgi:amino-acid N-acetyltransferase
MSAGLSIERARPEDRDAILRLVIDSQLPPDGLTDHLDTAVVARDGGHIVGSAALEIYPDGALLRSVAIAPDRRGRGLGQELTREALGLAESLRVPAVFLLTTTAERFFPKFGFATIGRDDVPAGVRRSVEFTSACPASAVVMRKVLLADA